MEQLKEINSEVIQLSDDLRSYKEIFDELLDHIMIIDGHTGKVVEINKIWMSTTGFMREEIIGKHFNEVFGDKKITSVVELEKIVAHDLVVSNRLLLKKDGSKFPVELSLSMVNFRSRNSILTVMRDISERKVTEDKIKELNSILGEQNSTKDKLFSIIAHDLRNQFGVLMSFSDILLKDINSMPEAERVYFLSQIEQVSKATYELLSNLLNWARSQTGSLVIKKDTLIINQIINSVCFELDGLIISKKLVIKIDNSQKIIVNTDGDLLRTVFRNLLSNAIKFSKVGGTIEINFKVVGTFVEVEIKDNGVGIDEEAQKTIFKAVGISKKGTANEEGTGLGLTLCKEFIEKLGGRIWFKSTLGEGTSIFFTVEVSQ